MMMKRNSSRSREAMERTEFSRDATRLLREFQYLGTGGGVSLHPLAPLPPPPGALGPAATPSSWPCPWGSVLVGPGWPAHN